MDELSKEIEERIKMIYNDCWLTYKKYLESYDMVQYEENICELQKKYHNEEFLEDILYGFKRMLNILQESGGKNREIEERIKSIYNDCWAMYKEYLGDHNMSQYNRRVCELKEKYLDEEFMKDILYGFIKKLNVLQTRYLMAKDGRIGYKVVGKGE